MILATSITIDRIPRCYNITGTLGSNASTKCRLFALWAACTFIAPCGLLATDPQNEGVGAKTRGAAVGMRMMATTTKIMTITMTVILIVKPMMTILTTLRMNMMNEHDVISHEVND